MACSRNQRKQVKDSMCILQIYFFYYFLTSKALHAHLAYLFLNTPFEEFDSKAVVSLISAQLFLSAHHPYNLDPVTKKSKKFDKKLGNMLAIPDTEMFDLFQKHKGNILKYLSKDERECNECLEAVVRVVTMTGGRTKPSGYFSLRYLFLVLMRAI